MTRNDCSSFAAPIVAKVSRGRLLAMFGLFFITIGLLLMLAGRLPVIGKLPGDLFIRRGRLQIYLPIGTSLVLSLLLSLALRIYRS